MTLDDLIRLASATGGTAADVAPRGIPAPFGPPAPAQPMPLAPAVAQPPNPAVPSLGDAVLGPAGPLERFASRVPENGITSLLDLAGTLLRGRSAYRDAATRANYNATPDAVADVHTAARERLQKANDEHDKAVRDIRITQLQSRIDKALARRAALADAARTPGHAPEALAGYKNEAADIDAQLPQWTAALARLTGESTLAAAPSPLALPDQPIPQDLAGIQAKSRAEALGTGQGQAAAPPKAGDSEYEPTDFVKTDRSSPYLEIPDTLLPKTKDKLTAYAVAHKLPIVGKKERASLDLIDAARSGVASVLNDAQPFLPDKPLNAVQGGINWLKGATRLDPNLASWKTNRLRAVEQVQAAAALGTGMRLNRDVIKAAAENDIPNEFDWKGSAAGKAQKLQSLYDALEGAILGDSGARERLIAAIKADAAPQRPNPSAPLVGSRAAPAATAAPTATASDSATISVPGKGMRRIARSLLPEAIRRGAKEVQ